MNKKVKIIVAFVLFIFFIIGAYFLYGYLKDRAAGNNLFNNNNNNNNNSGSQESTEDERNKTLAPDFIVYDKDGKRVKLSDYFGKPIVLNFWASWCRPCKEEMPYFDQVNKEMKDDVQFLMIDMVDGMRETKEKGERFINKQGFSFPVFYDNDQAAAMTYFVNAIPTTYFIDSKGYLVTMAEGGINKDILMKGIEMITKDNFKNKNNKDGYNKISAQEAKQIMDNEKVTILDVRTKEEYDAGFIKNAILIPYDEISSRASEVLKDKNEKILLYCRSGRRSKIAADILMELGYTNVYDFGGINSWKYDIVK